MNAVSPWVLNVNATLNKPDLKSIYKKEQSGYFYEIYNLEDSCWMVVTWPKGSRVAFRIAYSPNDHLVVRKIDETKDGLSMKLLSLMGEYQIDIELPNEKRQALHYKSTLNASAPLLFPFWPRDIIPLGAKGSDILAEGEVKVKQVGTRSGQLYFSLTRPKAGSVFYFQNLTSLADYNQQTETSAGETVGGNWPEIGFALPPTLKNKPLEPDKSYTLSDAFIMMSDESPDDEAGMVRQYVDMLADIYLQIPKPETTYKHWPDILQNGLNDLIDSPGCWSQVSGNQYFNAYVCDYATPPEIMVQLAVLLPLLDYVEWSDVQLAVMKKIKKGLPAFFDEKYGTIMRWHPKKAGTLEGEEEQKQPLVMDSWYLHHPLLNLSRLALKGDEVAKKLFLDSLPFAITVAHHFHYEWPVFYKMDTLEVVKAETQPGKGGEKDVPGLYAHVMLQAWELTGDKKYLAEAEKAALKLKGLGFELFYQANNTSFAAGAMLRLFKETKKEIYREMSYLCLANVFRNTRVWDCNYGYGKNFPSFFALFPLNDAPYTAVYEEQEVFCAFHDYLRHAENVDILPSVRLLIAEYIRFLVERAVYYYPTMLPKDMLAETPKIGELDPNLWIALEDMHDGWEKCGTVGQEVYGAGNAFGILPRHYMNIPGEDFMVFTDYPTYGFNAKKGKPVTFQLAGDGRIECRMMIVKTGKHKLPEFKVNTGSKNLLNGKAVKDGHQEYILSGNDSVKIAW